MIIIGATLHACGTFKYHNILKCGFKLSCKNQYIRQVKKVRSIVKTFLVWAEN